MSVSMNRPLAAALCAVLWTSMARADGAAAPAAAPAPQPEAAAAPAAPAADATANPAPAPEAAPAAAPAAAEADDSQVTSQVASFAVTKLKDSPAVVTVISAEDIRNMGARDLIDILYTVPGFFLGQDVQGVIGPGFRGLWGNEGKILLLIDGKEMNELMYSGLQLGNEFPVELIERVEVVRGPGSVIYGGNAELSVINIVTRSVQGGTDLMVYGNYGQMTTGSNFAKSYSSRGLTLSGRYVVEQVPGLSAFASASIGQGQRSASDLVTATQRETMMGNSALDPAVVQAGIGFRDIQATFLYHHLALSSISDSADYLAPKYPTYFDSYHFDLQGKFKPTDRLEFIPRFNVTYQEPWSTPDEESSYYYKKSARRLRGRLVGRWAPIDQLQLTLGADAMFDHGSAPGPYVGLQTPFGDTTAVNYQTFAAFLEAFTENPVLNGAAGIRWDRSSYDGGAGSLVPRLVVFRSFGPVNLKGLFSLAFRSPGFENINAGQDIKPERTMVFEFEGSVDITKKMRLSANVFDVSIDAPITYSVGTDPASGEEIEVYKNLGKIGTRGVEAGYTFRGDWGRVEANYSFYTPSVTDDVDAYQVPGHGSQFLGAPAHRITLIGTYKPLKWLSISPTLIVLGERYGIEPRTVTTTDGEVVEEDVIDMPWQVLANLFVRVESLPVKGLDVGLGIYNIFGANYRFLVPYTGGSTPMPGFDRQVMLRLGYTFEPTYD